MGDKGEWLNRLYGSIGNFTRLETVDGVSREGRLSGVRLRQLQLDGKTVEIITELELNGDPTDCVEMYRISSINFG